MTTKIIYLYIPSKSHLLPDDLLTDALFILYILNKIVRILHYIGIINVILHPNDNNLIPNSLLIYNYNYYISLYTFLG